MGKPKLSDEERFPEMFAVNRRIDRRQCTRVVPMRVLVLGMCRTGTACTSYYHILLEIESAADTMDSHVGSLEDARIHRLLPVRRITMINRLNYN